MFRGQTSKNDPENKVSSQQLQNNCDKYVKNGVQERQKGWKEEAFSWRIGTYKNH